MHTREQLSEWGKRSAVKQWGHITREQRFWKKVDKRGDNDCWPWTACKATRFKGTYGHFRWCEGDRRLAHRVAYELSKGPIPKGMSVCHSCDNGLCCNPAHLWVGTHQDNMRDMARKGRARCVTKGTKNAYKRGSKYSVEFVKQLQAEHIPKKVTHQMLAKKYGLKEGAVRGILWGSSYITDPNWKWK